MDIEEAMKVINKRTERLLEEFKIEKEAECEDEPKIAYLMQEIRANKTLLNELDKKEKIINEMVGVIIDSSICDYFIKQNCKHYAGENRKLCDECIIEYFTKKAEG